MLTTDTYERKLCVWFHPSYPKQNSQNHYGIFNHALFKSRKMFYSCGHKFDFVFEVSKYASINVI